MALKQIEKPRSTDAMAATGVTWRARVSRYAADWSLWTLLVLVGGATFLHLYGLNRSSISPWDESIHAIVAQHVAQHPLRPTLFETAALVPNPPTDWKLTHIWLHIPPFGIWAAALGLRLFGNTPFAVRLPGVLFVASGMLVSYVLGRRLIDRVAGLAGATFVGFTPYFMLVSQGYVFGDLTETPLLLLTPLAFYFLVAGYRTGRLRWLVGAGCVAGLCYLCKAGIGILPVLGGLAALYACERLFPPEAGWRRVGLRGVAVTLAAVVAVAGPYTLYTDIAFPTIAKQETHNWSIAIFSNYENWGRPPDYHLTMYLYAEYGSATALLLLGSIVALAVIAWRRRSRADTLVLTWILALYIPLSLAVTKAAPMTIAAAPAWGYTVARVATLGLAARSRVWRSVTGGALLGAGLLGIGLSWLLSGPAAPGGSSVATQVYTASLPPIPADIPPIIRLTPLIFAVGLSALAGGLVWLALRMNGARAGSSAPSGPLQKRRFGRCLTIITLVIALVGVGVTWLDDDWTVVTTPRMYVAPGPAVGAMIALHTPANASIVLNADASVSPNANFMVMFWARRDLYMSHDASDATLCAEARVADGKQSPFYVLARGSLASAGLPLPIAMEDGWMLYQPDCA